MNEYENKPLSPSLTPAQEFLQNLWEEHLKFEFTTHNTEDTLDTMVADAYVNDIPVLTGGRGRNELRAFYSHHFIPQMPPDTEMTPLSRTIGNDRLVVPYVVGGLGGLTLLSDSEVASLGVFANETYLTGNIGGGVKWFATRHVGLSGDARFIAVKNRDEAPFFGQQNNRYGGRFHGGLVLTY